MILVQYELKDGFTKEVECTDKETALWYAQAVYEDCKDCKYARVIIDGETVKELIW